LSVPIEKLPLSNVYAAAKISKELPTNSIIHIGASNTVRAWTFFDLPVGVKAYGNVGCRGIDGVLSSAVGAALADKTHLHFCTVGDLMFYYDMNSIGNRDITGNLRILLINNNGGGIFKQSVAPGHRFFGDEATNEFIAAADHFGKGQSNVVKSYVESLGFRYISAETKEKFDSEYKIFVSTEITEQPLFFEVFTKDYDDREAFDIIGSIDVDSVAAVKQVAKQFLGNKGVEFVRKITRKE
jgi:2-succinyl-5-enolpyruvyl-6-hydroxy-3-cyclohexene-1-carboxylate synthase